LFLAWLLLSQPGAVELGPGVLAAEDPVQHDLDAASPFDLKGYRITPLADFRIRAKVLSREDYSMDEGAKLSPVDLALGWGRMSDEQVLEGIEISQSGRWYRWRSSNLPIPRQEISRHSANMHLVPANELIEDDIDAIREGQIVELSGHLIRADGDDGWHWVSSLTRNDKGGGSCELVYVRRARIIY
jgi:hypothetical protein